MGDPPVSRPINASNGPFTTVADPRVCEFCRILLFEPHAKSIDTCDLDIERSTSDLAIDTMKQSAMNGCPLCDLVWETIQTKLGNALGVTKEDRNFRNILMTTASDLPRMIVKLTFHASYHCPTLIYKLGERKSSDRIAAMIHHDLEYIIVNLRPPDTIAPNIFTRDEFPKPQGSTASESSWARCISWLDQCMSHELCNQAVSTSKSLPTRLIDVGTSSTFPRLRQGKDLEPGAKYVTLSHCWGDQKIVTLTKSTTGPFLERIPMDILPRTFQHAITITRRLTGKYGVRFLWIDSLCILQDSPEDWNEEAPRMAEVYGNCWCNIAATHAPDGRTGLFASREPKKLLPIFLKALGRNTHEPVEHLCVNASRWGDNIDDAPLNKRGWVAQERSLSPRILHFAAGEIFFECQRGRASETFFEGEPTKNLFDGLDENGYPLSSVIRTSATETSMQYAIEAWSWQVHRYSYGRLTKSKDKLVAISGISKVFQGFFKGSDYLVGLWKHELVQQLLWIRLLRPFVPEAPKSTYVAPSWSWASVEGPCAFSWKSSHKTQELVEVIDSKVQLKGGDPFGQVSDGFIRLRCHLLKGRLDNQKYTAAALGDHINLNTVERLKSLFFIPDVNLKMGRQDLELDFVPVIYNEISSGGLTRALVLQPTHEAKGQFRRVGIADSVWGEQAEILKNTTSLGITEFEDFDGTHYTISIV